MEVHETALPGVRLIALEVHRDKRGEFAETYDRTQYAAIGIGEEFVLHSYNRSRKRGTLRGFHYQRPPRSQSKLVRVSSGSVLDVVVDIRRTSPHFGLHVSFELSADEPRVVYVPHGFAHAFCTLEDHTSVMYKMSASYSYDHYAGIRWNDPELGIDWPVGANEAIVSERDRRHPPLAAAGLDDLSWPVAEGT